MSRSQPVILKRGQNIKYLPYAFTEQGVAMLSSVLHSDRAIHVNIEIMRAFVRLRQMLASHTQLARKLAALEKMVYPSNILGGLLGAAIDAVGDALGLGSKKKKSTRPVPREKLPRILFIWGLARVLPVQIKSLTITEQKFDFLLNPVQAEVQLGLQIPNFGPKPTDKLGKGALDYTNGVKEAQAALNLVKAVELALDIIPF